MDLTGHRCGRRSDRSGNQWSPVRDTNVMKHHSASFRSTPHVPGPTGYRPLRVRSGRGCSRRPRRCSRTRAHGSGPRFGPAPTASPGPARERAATRATGPRRAGGVRRRVLARPVPGPARRVGAGDGGLSDRGRVGLQIPRQPPHQLHATEEMQWVAVGEIGLALESAHVVRISGLNPRVGEHPCGQPLERRRDLLAAPGVRLAPPGSGPARPLDIDQAFESRHLDNGHSQQPPTCADMLSVGAVRVSAAARCPILRSAAGRCSSRADRPARPGGSSTGRGR
ncbi:hypothetical protein DFR74_11549 [Nocardia puris]|uniref:Uncharacterized protein n=1 Tax=Nocardia puris TaxID=208602 RepID=A0A366D584_9NOCA|nr:hypothetical protein DFR74_11549 [Nocardia puris]